MHIYTCVESESSCSNEWPGSQKFSLKLAQPIHEKRVSNWDHQHNLLTFLNCFIRVVPIIPHYSPLPHPTPPPSSHSQSSPYCPGSWVICICSLTRSLPLFPPLSPSPLVSVSLFLVPHLSFNFAHLFLLFIRFLL